MSAAPAADSPIAPVIRPFARLEYLDSIRGLSALYVAACHAYLMYAADVVQAADLRSLSGGLVIGTAWLMFGRAAVAVFIVLSGYCLMLPVVQSSRPERQPGFWHFIGRRARRILPPYYGALAVSLALIVTVPALDDPSIGEWHKSFPALSTGSVLSHVVLIHNYFPAWQYAIDHPLWSIATEWQIYFLFPLLLLIGTRRGDFAIVTTAAAITVALNLFLLNLWPEHNPWPPQFIGLFGFGMACASWNFPAHPAPPLEPRRWSRQAIVLLAVGAVATVVFGPTRQQQLPDLLVGGGIGCALVFLTNEIRAGRRPAIVRALESPSLVGLGHFSYSLYLLHAPLLALFYVAARGWGLGLAGIQVAVLGIGLPLTIAASYLFHLVFERPFLRSAKVQPRALAA